MKFKVRRKHKQRNIKKNRKNKNVKKVYFSKSVTIAISEHQTAHCSGEESGEIFYPHTPP
jgi:hypothetical protein